MQQPQLFQMFQLTNFLGVINFIPYVRLESFHSKLFHVLSITYSLNCVTLVAHFPVFSFVAALFFHTNTHIGKERLTFLFTEITENFLSFNFHNMWKICIGLGKNSATTPITVSV